MPSHIPRVKWSSYFLCVLMTMFVTGPGMSDTGSRSIRVTYVEFGSKAKRMAHPNRVCVYESATNQVHEDSMDYWPRMIRNLCGDEEDAPESHRFRNADVNLRKCPELVSLVRRHGGGRVENLKQRRSTCDQDHGLLALTLSFYKAIPGLREHIGDWVSPTDSYASVCDAYAIYVQALDTVVFVDSLDLDYSGAQRPWGFSIGYFDEEGKHYYYRKQGRALRYDIGTRRIDTLLGFSHPVIPANSMSVLAYSDEVETLSLLEDHFKPVKTIEGKLYLVWSVYAMSETVYLVAAEEPTERPIMACWLYDFEAGTREKLFVSSFGQILEAEWVDP